MWNLRPILAVSISSAFVVLYAMLNSFSLIHIWLLSNVICFGTGVTSRHSASLGGGSLGKHAGSISLYLKVFVLCWTVFSVSSDYITHLYIFYKHRALPWPFTQVSYTPIIFYSQVSYIKKNKYLQKAGRWYWCSSNWTCTVNKAAVNTTIQTA